MKRGITVERKYDHNDIPCIVIKKKRGNNTHAFILFVG